MDQVLRIRKLLIVALLLFSTIVRAETETPPAFSLIDHNGERFESSRLRGSYAMIYFGYLACPDICPLELNTIGQALHALTDIPVHGVFISLDPARDNPETIGRYVQYFHPDIIGLTGTPDEIRQAADQYHIRFRIEQDGENYLIDHSIHIAIADPEGKLQALTPYGISADDLVDLVRNMATGNHAKP